MDKITVKIITIGVIGIACFVASLLVLGLGSEREARRTEAQTEVSNAWGAPQLVVGPLLTFTQPSTVPNGASEMYYVLPETLTVESTLSPEVRKRGIFSTTVYKETLRVSGTFSPEELGRFGLPAGALQPTLSVGVRDTRSIEKQTSVSWNDRAVAFEPGAGTRLLEGSGIHAQVPFDTTMDEYSFSFDLELKGSEEALFSPVGGETEVHVASGWATPKFTGAFLPSERTVSDAGFDARWRVSSFGRNYPQSWKDDGSVTYQTLSESAFGVALHDTVDIYTQLERSVKYAILFIVITFAAFFLFETMTKVRIHPVQYLLVGVALALFYLLLLSLAEQIGFLIAYLVASGMVVLLITGYSSSILHARGKAALVGTLVALLYGYLYFVLRLEDQALLFGSLLLFVVLAATMYATRNIDWFGVAQGHE